MLDLQSRVGHMQTVKDAYRHDSTESQCWRLAEDILCQVIRILQVSQGVFECLWPQYMAGRQSLWSDNPNIVVAAVSLLSCSMIRALLGGTGKAPEPDVRAHVMLQVDRCDKLQHMD